MMEKNVITDKIDKFVMDGIIKRIVGDKFKEVLDTNSIDYYDRVHEGYTLIMEGKVKEFDKLPKIIVCLKEFDDNGDEPDCFLSNVFNKLDLRDDKKISELNKFGIITEFDAFQEGMKFVLNNL